MATPRMHKESDLEKRKRWKTWEENNPKIRLGKDAHQRWISFMEENQLKTNREAAIRLLDRWYEKQSTFPVILSQPTLHERSQPINTSTPEAVLMSDISEVLHELYRQDEASFVTTKSVFENVSRKLGALTPSFIGRCVCNAFPTVKNTKRRDPADSCKFIEVYSGIREIHTSEYSKLIKFEEIMNNLPDKFIVLEKEHNFILLGKQTNLVCNGNKVMIEIKIFKTGVLKISLCNKTLHEKLKLTKVDFNKASLDSLYAVINSIRLCEGVPPNEIHYQNEGNILIQVNRNGDKVAYSTQCEKIIPITSLKKTIACNKCNSEKSVENTHNKIQNMMPVMSDKKSKQTTKPPIQFIRFIVAEYREIQQQLPQDLSRFVTNGCDTDQALTLNHEIHKKQHTGKKPIHCGICGLGFDTKMKLINHITIHQTKQNYECDVCGKCFSRPSRLKVHMSTHTGDKPYQCKFCGKGFLTALCYQIHMKIHTGDKQYTCDVCGKCFAHLYCLKAHSKIHLKQP